VQKLFTSYTHIVYSFFYFSFYVTHNYNPAFVSHHNYVSLIEGLAPIHIRTERMITCNLSLEKIHLKRQFDNAAPDRSRLRQERHKIKSRRFIIAFASCSGERQPSRKITAWYRSFSRTTSPRWSRGTYDRVTSGVMESRHRRAKNRKGVALLDAIGRGRQVGRA